jgi:hypothetical protein
LPAVFVGEPSDELKRVILHDIELIYGYFQTHQFYELFEKPSFRISGENIVAEKALYFKPQAQRPDAHQDNFGQIGKIKNKDSVIFSESLVSAYQVAYERKKQFRAEYQKLQQFIDDVNRATADKPLKLSPDDLMWTDDKTIPQPNEIPNTVRTVSEITFRAPSILDFQENLEARNSDMPWLGAKAYIVEEGIPKIEQPLVYQNGRWKLFYAAGP